VFPDLSWLCPDEKKKKPLKFQRFEWWSIGGSNPKNLRNNISGQNAGSPANTKGRRGRHPTPQGVSEPGVSRIVSRTALCQPIWQNMVYQKWHFLEAREINRWMSKSISKTSFSIAKSCFLHLENLVVLGIM
jgi:hypothetical protein